MKQLYSVPKIMMLLQKLATLCHIVRCRGKTVKKEKTVVKMLYSSCIRKARNTECITFKFGTLYLRYSIIAH